MIKLSKNLEGISDSATMAITARAQAMAKAGENVIALAAGEPDFITPDFIIQAAKAALDEGFTHYTPNSGMPELRAAWAAKVGRERGITYKPQQFIVSAGGKQAVYNIVAALAGLGDEVIVPVPYWVSYPEMAKLVGAQPVFIKTTAADEFKLQPKDLRAAINDRTRLLILNTPSNPTGAVYSRQELEALAEVLIEKQVPVLADEVYDALVYGCEFVSIASLGREIYDLTIVAGAVSKTYAMTGWRIGFAAGPVEVISAASNLQSHSTSGPNSIAQKAALAAVLGEQDSVEKMRQAFDERRQYMVKRLRAMRDITCMEPRGAFYTFPSIAAHYGRTIDGQPITNSIEFCAALLEHTKLALVPGAAFGDDQYMRLSYAASMEQIKQAMDRLEWFVNQLE